MIGFQVAASRASSGHVRAIGTRRQAGRNGGSPRERAPLICGALVLVLTCALPVRGADEFDDTIAPLFARRCLECHNGTERKGGLDLSSLRTTQKGGDSGAVLATGDPAGSLLWERIANDEMPPKRPLAAAEKELIRRWIADGAKWGTDPIDPFRYGSDVRAGYDWWSLKPVRSPELPHVKNERWPAGAIDRFILARLEEAGLEPSPPADKRTLIRRLSFDLLGLPPEPAEVSRFLTDESSTAYADLVERLLESPHYGERWGRHWLDIARFGESQGFERDKLRLFSWPYRDWVIDSFNRDLPYDEFIRLQLAGDALHPGDPRAVTATGFLVAGPWDEVGQSQQSAAMKAVVRQDELEDLIAVTGQTFLGLTVNCARCHDHKFDPITQTEYYRLAAVFAGVRHGERKCSVKESETGIEARIVSLKERIGELEQRLRGIDDPARQRILDRRHENPPPPAGKPTPLARWEFDSDLRDSAGMLHGVAHGKARVESGRLLLEGDESFVETSPLAANLREKTLEVWLTLARLDQQGGGAIAVESSSGAVFDAIVFGEREAGQWMAGSNGFSRTRSFDGPRESEAAGGIVQVVLTYSGDGTISAYRNGQVYGQPYRAVSLATFEAGKSRILLGLRHSPVEGNRLLAGAIERAALYDRALSADEVAALAGVVSESISEDQLLASLPAEESARRREVLFELSRLQSEMRLLAGGKVYAVVPGEPEPTWQLDRGNPASRRERVAPGGIRALGGLSADFGLDVDAPEPQRRVRLARWITDPRNPLTARVMANRLWHYHFGNGIVETPNDFGFNGTRPSHPELLDYLAHELAGNGWSLKRLHRLIVGSATYRQSSRGNPAAAKTDAGNRLLWRRTPQRLEAEAVRDSILQVTGALNPTMGGPGFQDFRTFTFNSQFYEMLDPVGYEFQRRTVYRTWVRSGRNEFLDVFDCPDPSTTAPRRAVTTTPLQALALLNHSFTLRMAERLADRVEGEMGNEVAKQLARVYDLAYSRPATPEEIEAGREFVARHGLAAWCRVVFNSNEFLYID